MLVESGDEIGLRRGQRIVHRAQGGRIFWREFQKGFSGRHLLGREARIDPDLLDLLVEIPH